jgi:hypothetical protein
MRTLSRFFIAFILLNVFTGALAVPADPTPKRIKQADGTSLTVRSRGDEVELHYLYLIYMRSAMEPAARNGVL